MSDTEEQAICQTCSTFEPQTWRKSLCKNCFHSLDEHSSDFLAHEAEIVAKEKISKEPTEASAKQTETKADSGKAAVQIPKDSKSKDVPKDASTDKSAAGEKVQRKYGAERAAAERSATWSWSIDLGREFGKSEKTASTDSGKGAPTSSSAPTTQQTPAKTSPQTSTKPMGKSPVADPSTSSSNTSTDTTTIPSMSKAKNVASKFESQSLSKGKTSARPVEIIRTGNTSVAALTGKLTDSSATSKVAPKTSDAKPTTSSTTDSKDKKLLEPASNISKPISTPSKTETSDTLKSKSKVLASKFDDKKSTTPPLATPSKVLPFGKDLLKSTKESSKRDSSSASSTDKIQTPSSSVTQKDTVSSSPKKDTFTSSVTQKDTPTSSPKKDTPISSPKKDTVTSSPKKDTLTGSVTPKDTLTSFTKKADSSLEKHNEKSSKNKSTIPVEKLGNSSSNVVEKREITSGIKSEKPESLLTLYKGKESLNEVSCEDLFSLLLKADNSGERISEETKLDLGVSSTSGDEVEEVGQRMPSSGFRAEENVECTANGREHAEAGTRHSPGRSSKNTDITNAGVIETKGNSVLISNDQVTSEGVDAAVHHKDIEGNTDFSPPLGSETLDSARRRSEEREKEKVENEIANSSSNFGTETTTNNETLDSGKEETLQPQQKSAIASREVLQRDTTNQNELKQSCAASSSTDLQNDKISKTDNEDSKISPTISSSSSLSSSREAKRTDELINGIADNERKDNNGDNINEEINKLNMALSKKDEELSDLGRKLLKMEEEMKAVQNERDQLRKASVPTQKDDLQALIGSLRAQLSKMEDQCSQLGKDNQSLIDKLKEQEVKVKQDMENRDKNCDNVTLEEDLEAAEKELEDVKDENKDLQSHIMEMKNEMNELYDHFRETEYDEFRELQKELDITSKNCRILQFKLRKAERRNELIEQDRVVYEEKLRALQDRFDSQDAKNHIRLLEEELRMAKEVSVRLHDELDLLEDRKNKAVEESRHLTELLEHTDKRQFRMEMEIDKLRDVVSDLKRQLKEAQSGNNKESTPDRKPPLGTVGRQGSREHDVSQLMKDLYDSMERENDLKDQLKFTEEEAKMMRRRVSDMDEENENLRLQLQKMSEKASKHKKKEKETQKELDEERKHLESMKTAISAQCSVDENAEGEITDVILVVGPEGSEVITEDGVSHANQRKDSTDEDLMNVLQMRVQLEMLEHELMTSHQKLDEMDLEHENLQAEIKFLQERLAEKETSGSLPEPSTPNAYYEDKLREMSQEADELRWKVIEKDRELERLSVVQTRHGREHTHKKVDHLKKSRSLEEADVKEADLKRQLEHAYMDIVQLKRKQEELTELNSKLKSENEDLKNKTPIPSVLADDAAVENIELKENLKKMEETNRAQSEKIKSLSEQLQKLARDPRSYTSIATSPTVPGSLHIPGIPLVGPGARAGPEPANPADDGGSTRSMRAQMHVLQRENQELRALINAQGATGYSNNTGYTLPTTPAATTHHKSIPLRQLSSKTPTNNKENGGSLNSTSADLSTKTLTEQTSSTSLGLDTRSTLDNVSHLASSQSNMDNSISKAETATAAGNTKEKVEDEDAKAEDEDDKGKRSRGREGKKEEPLKSVLSEYPGGKSKVFISGSESRVELMEKVLEMDDEIGDLINMMKKREEECEKMRREMKHLNSQLKQVKDESRRMELDLLRELDMMHDKNSVMSNLLDIINERAEAAEEELERKMQEETTHSPARSASNVSQVSALSDTSVGSDEVFLTAYVSKEGVITRDWESKLKVRIESLEHLLAEERQKVTMAEKKLLLAGIDTVSPSVSDDVKLRIREKELLQEELLTSQRHLHIATDQINGLKARVHALEDVHVRLKAEYVNLCEEVDKSRNKQDGLDADIVDAESTEGEKIEEAPFVAKRISVVEAPKFQEQNRTETENNKITKLEEELQKYQQIARELEYKVEEINDIWRSKSSASERERDELDKKVKERIGEIAVLEGLVDNLRKDLAAKEKIIAANEATIADKDREIARLNELTESREVERRKAEQEKDSLTQQLTQKANSIKGLNDTVRIRDERLKEKDEMLMRLNNGIEKQKAEMKTLTEKINSMAGQMKEQAARLALPKSEISTSSVLAKEIPRGCQTDAEKENFRLRETVKKLQVELDKVLGEKRAVEANLEKTKTSLEEAMLMWDRDRNVLQRDANILEEKVRLYEAFNSMNKEETIEALKAESQAYFREKEVTVCEMNSLKMKHEADVRVHKEQVAKLQAELTDKLKLLKTEVDSNSHIASEMNRLKRQAEMAYRLQQEQRVFKAENLAMKVRYETRIDKLSKEHNKMLIAIDKLQKERDMDKQIIDSVQRNLNLVKDSYTEELVRSQDDKTVLRRYVKEIEDSRAHLDDLQKHIRDLRDKTVDQERLRADLINKFATDRSSWEIDRAGLNSKINQLEEKVYTSSRQQERSKDIQVNMGMAWDKERREQQRLLSEAHSLALDLQEQLKARDEAFAHDRKELIRQIEIERTTWAQQKRDGENEITEMKTFVKKVAYLEKRVKDLQEKSEKDLESWNKEKADLFSLATEARHAHARDTNKVEHVLSKLICLRELGIMLTSQPKWDCLEEKPPDRPESINQMIIDYVGEAVNQISQAADEMIILTNPVSDEEAIKRISNSEIDLLKQQFSRIHHGTNDVVVTSDVSTSSVVTKTRIEEQSAGVSRRLPNDTILSVGPGQPHAKFSSETVTKSASRSILSSPPRKEDLPSPTSKTHNPVTQISTGIPRPENESNKFHFRAPSYASGSRSAQSSRATTPEVHDSSIGSYFSSTYRNPGSQDQNSNSSIPHLNISQPHKQTFAPSSSVSNSLSTNEGLSPKRPGTFVKSLSVDSSSILDSPASRGTQHTTSLSASSTPTQPVTSADMVAMFLATSVITSPADQHLTVSKQSSSSGSTSKSDKLSPRSARRYFYDSYPATVSTFPASLGYQSWPERRSVTPTLHVRQTSLPDPDEVRREAEEEHDIVSSKLESRGKYSVMKTSTSWDEQTLRKDATPVDSSISSSSHSTLLEGAPSSSDDHQPGTKHSTAKEKRRLFTKTSSLDSTVGSSIAKVGVSVMPLAAPTGFAPSELFAAVKGKLKPVFKKKFAGAAASMTEPRPPSPLFIQTDVPDFSLAGQGNTQLLVPGENLDAETLPTSGLPDLDKIVYDITDKRSRDAHRSDVPHGKWRSKSADRPQGPLRLDVVRASPGVWQFNETAV